MKELAMHVYDLMENSTAANSTLVELTIKDSLKDNIYAFTIKDNGKLPCWKILSGSPSSLVECLSRALTTGLQSVFLDSSSSSLPFPSCTLATLDYSPSPDMPFLFTSRCLLYIPVLYLLPCLPPSISPTCLIHYP